MGNNNTRFKNNDGTRQLSQITPILPFMYDQNKNEWTKIELYKIQNIKIPSKDHTRDYDAKSNDEQKQIAPNIATPSLIVMSFNIWFGDENFEQRHCELIKILQAIQPHVFCFQEVTARWLKLFQQIPFVQNNYSITETSDNLTTTQRYGNLIGARRDALHICALNICNLKSVMGRRLLSMEVMLKDTGEVMWINTVHLESKNTANTRIKQLQIIFKEYIQRRMKQDESMLMGDFNFRDNDMNNTLKVMGQECKENEYLNEDEFMDCWKVFAKQNNLNVQDGWTRRVGYRYDRILLKTNRWKVMDFKIIGDAEKRMPSDHKGVAHPCENVFLMS
eukprot:765898_1